MSLNQTPLEASPPRTVRLAVPRHRVFWAYAMLALIALVWLAETVVGFLYGAGLNGSQNTGVLVLMGAKVNQLIVQGQYWRLITANFLHIGLVHLLFNGYALMAFGTEVEQRFGAWRFVALYMLTGLGGSVASFVGNNAVSAGASGAVFGLIGAMIVFFATYRQELGQFGRRRLTSLLMIAGFNLMMGISMTGIDNLGHVGGLVTGLVLGWAFCPRYKVEANPGAPPHLVDQLPRSRAILVTILVTAILVLITLRVAGAGQ